ncbi:DNA cytosine methyltransferase [Streptomyces bobili]|uniref:hypothetical protein n=1 Tax=Streptomyces bobili TaxID=67280 RepID=UPI00371CB848
MSTAHAAISHAENRRVPASASKLAKRAADQGWSAAERWEDGAFVLDLYAVTDENGGESTFELHWTNGRFNAKESEGVIPELTLKGVGEFLAETPAVEVECELCDPESGKVCHEHAVTGTFDARFGGWGAYDTAITNGREYVTKANVTRNYDLVDWEDGPDFSEYWMPGYSERYATGQMTLQEVVPLSVRNRALPVVPVPDMVGDCHMPDTEGWDGRCESYGVRLYKVSGRLMCALHVEAETGIAARELDAPSFDEEEQRYAEDCKEDARRTRIFREAEAWAEEKEGAGHQVPARGFEEWCEDNHTGGDFLASFRAWLTVKGWQSEEWAQWAFAEHAASEPEPEPEPEPAAALGDDDQDGEPEDGHKPRGEIVEFHGHRYDVFGWDHDNPEAWGGKRGCWGWKRLPITQTSASLFHSNGGEGVETREKAVVLAREDAERQKRVRDLTAAYGPHVGPVPLTLEPVIQEIGPGYERVFHFGWEFRLIQHGKKWFQVTGATGEFLHGPMALLTREAALSNIESFGFRSVSDELLRFVRWHDETRVHCVMCEPGFAWGRGKSRKAVVDVAGVGEVFVCDGAFHLGLLKLEIPGEPVPEEAAQRGKHEEQTEALKPGGTVAKGRGPRVGDITFSGKKGAERTELLGHVYAVTMLAGTYTVEHRESGERIVQGEKSRPAMKRAILADAVARGAVEAADHKPEPVAEDGEPKRPQDPWAPFSAGDLVTVDEVPGEWELVCHAQINGVWQAVLIGDTERRQEFRTRDLALEVPAAEVWRPEQEERQPEGLELDAESLAEWLDSLSAAEREELAGLFPARWLYPPMVDDAPRVLNLFCGCGGTCVGLRRVLGVEVDMVCVDTNADAVATQRAAGCTAIQADVTTLDPTHPALRYTRGLIVTPPCIDYTQAGKGLGHLAENIEILCEAFEDARRAGGVIPLTGVPGAFTSYASPDGRSWAQVREALESYTGKTGGLMLEVAIWSLGLQLGGAPLEWVAVEQSSKLPEEIRREVWVDFQLAGWGMAEWTVRDAADNGSPSHRVRSLLVARRDGDSGVSLETSRELVTWASDATRRPADLEVITRGERKTSGGNAYRMGRVIPAVTGKIRSVDVGEKGGRFTIVEVAKLVTMPPTHPVQGSRTAQCQQLGDVVAPVMACALLGVALGVEWMPHLSRYLGELYPEAHGQEESADTAENPGGDSPAERAPEIPAADTEQELRDTDPVAVFIASREGSPTRARVLWWMERHQAQRLCSDPRTNWRKSMLVWTSDPGEKGEDWEFVEDRRPEESAALFAELFITPLSWEDVQERRPGLCDQERWCNHAWPCGRDYEVWKAQQPKSRAELRRERQATERALRENRRVVVGAPENGLADTEPKESVRERLRAEIDAQPKPEPGAMERLLEKHYGLDWRPLCTGFAGSEGREFEDDGQDDEPEAAGQGIAPVSAAQRRAAWRIMAGESAPAVAELEREQCPVCRCRELVGARCQGCGHELVICGGDEVFDGVAPQAAKEPVEEPRTVICGPAVYALTVPARVDERGAVARIRDLAARVNIQHQDMPEPALADPFEELRREAAELRRDVEEWAAEVAALAVAEAERIVRAAEQELAELRGLELELMSREVGAVRDALEWAPVALPHRARARVAVWTTAASWAVFWSAAWHESLSAVRPVR